jgi:hypothetical protein
VNERDWQQLLMLSAQPPVVAPMTQKQQTFEGKGYTILAAGLVVARGKMACFVRVSHHQHDDPWISTSVHGDRGSMLYLKSSGGAATIHAFVKEGRRMFHLMKSRCLGC